MESTPANPTMPRSTPPPFLGLPPAALAVGAAVIAGFIWLIWDYLIRSVRIATGDPNWSHVLVVPIISVYFIFLNRERILAKPAKLCWAGLFVMVAGIFGYLWMIYPGRNDMLRGYSIIVAIFGLVLFAQGWKRMHYLWFPVAYLVFAVKIPDSIWQQIAFKLQVIAAWGSEITLTAFGAILDFDLITSGQDMTIRYLEGNAYVEHSFSIAEACSGLRMLMAFCALGVALAFLWDRRWWQKLIMVSMAIPIAIAVNIGRVTVLGLLNLVDPEYAKGDFHIAVGMVMLIPAAILFMGLGWALDKIIIEEEKDPVELPQHPVIDTESDDTPPTKLVRNLALGAGMMLMLGLTYVLLINGAGAVQAIEALSGPASLGLAVPALGLVALCFLLARRWTPGITTGVALAAGMLITSAIGLQSVVATQKAVLLKKPVEMRHEFFTLPKQVGTWEFLRDEDPLPKEREEELGTTHYITRTYYDTTLEDTDPAAFGRVHLAYYTGMVDTVPHVPDRCWVAADMENTGLEQIDLDLEPLGAQPEAATGKLVAPVQLQDPIDGRTQARLPEAVFPAKLFSAKTAEGREVNTTYFFVANGGYFSSPNQVRTLAFNIRDEYSYYCKVEVMFPGLTDAELSEQRTEALLSALLPEIMACLPDWVDVKEGRWPAEGSDGP